MEKSVQAIDIATVTSGNRGNMQAAPAENGSSTPFAEVLTPAQQSAGQPGSGQHAGGNPLPGEQPLPAKAQMKTLLDEAGVLLTSPDPAIEQVAADSTPLSQQAAVPGEEAAAISVTELSVEHIVIEAVPVPATPADQVVTAAHQAAQAMTGRQAGQAAVVAGEPPAPVSDNAGTSRQAASGVLAQLQGAATQQAPVQTALQETSQHLAAQSSPGAVSTTTGETAQAGVRELARQAAAAQLAQDGQQSLSGNSRQGGLPGAITFSSPGVETGIASFSPVLTDALGPAGVSRVAVPVGEAGWGRAVGEQVVWHVSQNIKAANLRLNPQHLGPLEMQVQMEGDKATLAFASQHAVVRDALESALPRLREMFAQSGLDIVDVNVSQEHAPRGQEQQSAAAGGAAADDAETVAGSEQLPGMEGSVIEGRGLVDYYI